MDISKNLQPKNLSDRTTFLIAGIIAVFMLGAAFLSMQKDSLTFDELAHIGAGYSYLARQDYRLNPEHPPLFKDLAAFPLLFLHLNFPNQSQSWFQNAEAPPWWVQFNFGNELLYKSDNNPRQIIFWARTPMILLFVALGLFLFWWARKLFGNTWALLAFLLFALSPTLLANGRLVTNDVAAAFGALAGTYFFIEFLKNPSKKNIFAAGIALGVSLCLKFTLLLLIPFFGALTILYPLLFALPNTPRLKLIAQYIYKTIFVGVIGTLFIIWPVYQFHILNYPASRQVRDTISDLSAGGITPIEQIAISMADTPGLRPLSQFARGVLMANQRVSFGNTTYFLGEVSTQGWKTYFPVLFFEKEPLALYVLLFLALGGIFISLRKNIRAWLKANFSQLALVLFLALYWASALIGNLNIGIRHLLPTFPFLYLLIAWGILELFKYVSSEKGKFVLTVLVRVLLLWLILSSIRAFPYYISYFNELGGKTKNGYKIAVDSNYDWGQDFYRLQALVKKYGITKLNLDYFGGEDPAYWLGATYVPLNPQGGAPHPTGWIAVSVNQLQGGKARPAHGYDQNTHYYDWLGDAYLVDRAGTSIFLSYIP